MAISIVNMIRRFRDQADLSYRTAIAEHAGAVASSKAWDEQSTFGGGFDTNPYNTANLAQRENRAKNEMNELNEIYKFAVETFLEKST
jgi:predicted mannosyl-3-phosphoglycerate phosphatase (HAD superfamily)